MTKIDKSCYSRVSFATKKLFSTCVCPDAESWLWPLCWPLTITSMSPGSWSCGGFVSTPDNNGKYLQTVGKIFHILSFYLEQQNILASFYDQSISTEHTPYSAQTEILPVLSSFRGSKIFLIKYFVYIGSMLLTMICQYNIFKYHH